MAPNCGIFAVEIDKNPVGFYSFRPVFVEKLGELYRLLEVIIEDNGQLPALARQFVKLSNGLSSAYLLKTYGSRFKAPRVSMMMEALDKPENKVYKELMYDYIDKKRYQMALLLMNNPDVLLFRNENGSLFKLSVSTVFAEPVTYLTKTPDGLSYTLKLDLADRIEGFDNRTPVIFLCKQPCVLLKNKVMYLTRNLKSVRISAMQRNPVVKVPLDKVDAYLHQFIAKILQTERVESNGYEINRLKYPLKAVCTLVSDTFGKSGLNVSFCYGDYKFGFDKSVTNLVQLNGSGNDISFQLVCRDFSQEEKLRKVLYDLGLVSRGADVLYLSPDSAYDDYNALLSDTNLTANFQVAVEAEIEKKVTAKNDWFDVDYTVNIHGLKVPFSSFRNNLLKGESVYHLPDGSQFNIPKEWFVRYSDLMRNATVEADHKTLKVKKHFAGVLAVDNQSVKSYVDDFTRKMYPVPAKLKATLRQYQHTGYSYLTSLFENGLGGCLADDMGLGKTLQFLTFFLRLYADNSKCVTPVAASAPQVIVKRELTLFDQVFDDSSATETKKTAEVRRPSSLVVVPTSVLFNWVRELQKFAPSLSYDVYYGPNRSMARFGVSDLIFTTYSLLSRDVDKLCAYQFECVVFDESQNIKNPASLTYRAAVKLRGRSRFVMTGTPIENSLADLWAQFSVICPGMLGNYMPFMKTYEKPSSEQREHLKNLISPFLLRRTKQEACTDLPPITQQTIWCQMDDDLASAYETVKSVARNDILKVEQTGKRAVSIFGVLTRLREMACDPAMVDRAELTSSKKSEILDRLVELHAMGHKALLFSSFVKQLDILAGELRRLDVPFEMLTGATDDRQRAVDRFQQSDDVTCFLISLKAGGTGLNLTAADYVFMLSPWWNPAAEQQAIDRAYRIGQTQPVMVYNFITVGTVEEKILKLQDEKRKLADTYVDTTDPLMDFSSDELLELLN